MLPLLATILFLILESAASFDFNYPNIKDDVYEQPVNLMKPQKNPHAKNEIDPTPTEDPWSPFDFSKFDAYISGAMDPENNRVKRRAKRRRGHSGKRRSKSRTTISAEYQNLSSTEVPVARRADLSATQQGKKKKQKKKDKNKDMYDPPLKENIVRKPACLREYKLSKDSCIPMQPASMHLASVVDYDLIPLLGNYGEDKDESVIEADVEYLRLTRKVINDEIAKFEDLRWLVGWFSNRSELIQEHMCNTRYYAVGIPSTMFTHSEEYMKRMCLFDNVYIDHIPYVVGEDGSLMAAVAPPVLHCDAATCTSVPFIDSVMFDERLSRSNVRTVTRCQASCRAHCRNDPDCLKRCSDRCLRSD